MHTHSLHTHLSAHALYNDNNLVPKQDYSCIFVFHASILRCLSVSPWRVFLCLCPSIYILSRFSWMFCMCKYCWQSLKCYKHVESFNIKTCLSWSCIETKSSFLRAWKLKREKGLMEKIFINGDFFKFFFFITYKNGWFFSASIFFIH